MDSQTDLTTSAQRSAAANWSANWAAIQVSQPKLLEPPGVLPAEMQWVWGRDGALTAMTDGRWWAGCSLPLRAAQFMLRKADLSCKALCYLSPVHAAQIRATLDAMKSGQAIIALVRDQQTLHMLLTGADFSADIARHRLSFTVGADWEIQLHDLLASQSGLATPTSFFRPITADVSPAEEMIGPAQAVFARCNADRAKKCQELRSHWHPRQVHNICVVAPTQFRLWDDTGEALAKIFADAPAGIEVLRFDPDDPASSSPLALATAAAKSDAMVTPNMSRADFPDLAPMEMPWATWLTTPRVPAPEQVGPHDSLLVADPAWRQLAIGKGWNPQYVTVACWPEMDVPRGLNTGVFAPSTLAIICDTQPLAPPASVEQYSSHRLLWEAIADELLNDPFALGDSPEQYLEQRLRQSPVETEHFNRSVFLDGVISHAYQQGLARLLIHERLPLQLHGVGWSDIEGFGANARGPIENRTQFAAAVAASTALIHVWPGHGAHAISSNAKPLLQPRRRHEFLGQARSILTRPSAAAPSSPALALNAMKIIETLRSPVSRDAKRSACATRSASRHS